MFKVTTALKKIAKLTKPIRVIQGSQGAAKTISILQLLINHAQLNDEKEITIFQSERTKMKRTVIRDFLKIMRSYGFFDNNAWNKTESLYTFPNGSYIEFVGLDVSDIGKGFRRDIVYFNEANRGKITFDTFSAIQSRSRITYVDYNPDAIFWAHTELGNDEDSEMLIVTFMDNEFLPEGERKAILKFRDKALKDINGSITDESNIKNHYWLNRWRIYGLGLVGKLDGTIIHDWEHINAVPEEAKLLGSGIDFGFTNDPTALVTVYKYNDSLVVDEILFRKGLGISDVAAAVKGLELGDLICDSAEPRSIAELNKYGLRAQGVQKGPGSVNHGIDLLRSNHILVTKRSANLTVALENYSWDTDSTGAFINKPNHMYSDIVDALRYLVMAKLGGSRGKYARPGAYARPRR